MQAVLESADPPPFSWFASLPSARTVTVKIWAIYAISMVKRGHRGRLYFGSGTNAEHGVTARATDYRPDGTNLPRFVAQAFRDGFVISHIGLLCWTPLPTPGLVPRARGLFLALEAAFDVIFHAKIKAITDSYFGHLVLWSADSVDWDPLCSHLPLTEAIRGGLEMTPEELETVAAIRAARNAVYGQRYRTE